MLTAGDLKHNRSTSGKLGDCASRRSEGAVAWPAEPPRVLGGDVRSNWRNRVSGCVGPILAGTGSSDSIHAEEDAECRSACVAGGGLRGVGRKLTSA